MNFSVTEIQEQNLIGVLIPDDLEEFVINDLRENIIQKIGKKREAKESKVNGFHIEEGNRDGNFVEIRLNAKSSNDNLNSIRQGSSGEVNFFFRFFLFF